MFGGLNWAETYNVWAREGENQLAMTRPWVSRSDIAGHDRRQSVWVLVAKAALWAVTEAEKKRETMGDQRLAY